MHGRDERQVDGEDAAHAGFALKPDLASEQPRELAADRQAEAGAAVLAARGAICLRKRLEDRLLLVERDADSGVDDAESDDLRRAVQGVVGRAPPGGRHLGDEVDLAFLRELERVAEQVVEDLLQTLGIGRDRLR